MPQQRLEAYLNFQFLALACTAFLSGANLRVFDSILPSVASEFTISTATAGHIVATFTLSYGLFQILYGPLGDRFGRIRVVSIATGILVCGSLGSAFARDLETLTLFRFLAGIGAAGIIPVSLAWIGDNTTYQNRQIMLGRFIGFILMGQIFGPLLGGGLAHWLNWRDMFFVFSAFFFLAMIILISIANHGRQYTIEGKQNAKITLRENFSNYRRVLEQRWCRIVLLTVFIEGGLFYGSFAFMGIWLEEKFSIDYLTIGILLCGFGLGGVIYTKTIKRLLPLLGEMGFVRVGSLTLAIFYVSVLFLNHTVIFGIACIVGGFGFYMLHNTLQTKASEMFVPARGTAIACFAMCLFCGQAIGTLIFGAIIDAYGFFPAFVTVAAGTWLLGYFFRYQLSKQ